MVLLSVQGMAVTKIAEVTFTSADRVPYVIHNFNTDGFGSLYPKYRGGRPKTFTLPARGGNGGRGRSARRASRAHGAGPEERGGVRWGCCPVHEGGRFPWGLAFLGPASPLCSLGARRPGGPRRTPRSTRVVLVPAVLVPSVLVPCVLVPSVLVEPWQGSLEWRRQCRADQVVSR
ncbi:hypothetical protein GCM10010317_040860 [Streptomyces mirabilis]|nr:hypothetical protein GCM10010317_040860 [Streptomyces mirabilis]